ncbi:hypothetical protein [Cellulomonas pakistanensis]|uniref:Uncharacterized protein n=1 Tax=Cellulomonas pakistanensis TaxID=992287 RepID=A0A919P8A6_9CELL|nr:hypothetical protein [Cellulomonas pakistanensis]GIG36209.1 hypothetical protein Cpa01nite_15900 [Cellulomonas pakistanensis]
MGDVPTPRPVDAAAHRDPAVDPGPGAARRWLPVALGVLIGLVASAWFPEHRVPLVLATVVVGSVASWVRARRRR